jgi:4-amino-4-deoxy-L-arabinose transferase-like glycosyltransferase
MEGIEEVKGEMKESVSEKEIEQRKSSITSSIKEKFSAFISDNYNKIFIALLIVAFIIRIIIFIKTMNQPLWWDEADYLSASKKWGLGVNVGDIWYYRRGFLWAGIGAIFFKLGIGEIGMRFLVVLFSTGIVAVSYILLEKMFNKKLALLSSVGLTFSWILVFFTGRILTDIPATFLVLLALLFFWKGYVLKEGNKFLYLFGLFFALAILTRMQSFMFVPPFLIYIFINEKFKMFKNKHLWITLGIFVLLLVPQFVLYTIHYGNPIKDLAAHYLGVGVSSGSFDQRTISMVVLNYFKDLPYMMSGTNGTSIMTLSNLIFILLIAGALYFFADLFIGFDKVFKHKNLQDKFFILIWILSLFLIMGYIGQVSYVEQRYISAALPFLFLIASSFLLFIGETLVKHFKVNKKMMFFLIIAVLILLLIPNITLANKMTEDKLSSYEEIRQAGLWIKANSNPTDLIITHSRPQIVYYAERSVQTAKDDADLFANVSSFEMKVDELRPRYLVLSAFEQSPEWLYAYPQNHTDLLTPVQAYSQNEQTVVVIYEFTYPA